MSDNSEPTNAEKNFWMENLIRPRAQGYGKFHPSKNLKQAKKKKKKEMGK